MEGATDSLLKRGSEKLVIGIVRLGCLLRVMFVWDVILKEFPGWLLVFIWKSNKTGGVKMRTGNDDVTFQPRPPAVSPVAKFQGLQPV